MNEGQNAGKLTMFNLAYELEFIQLDLDAEGLGF